MPQKIFTHKIKASEKLYMLVIVLTLFIAGIGIYGMLEMKKMRQQTQTLYADRLIPMQQLTKVRFTYSLGIISAAEQAHAHQITFKDALARIVDAQTAVTDNWKAYLLTYMTPEEMQSARKASALMRHSDEVVTKIKFILQREDTAGLDRIIKKDLYPAINPVIDQMNELLTIQVSVGQKVYSKNTEIYDDTQQQFILLIVLSLIFAIPFSFFLIRNIKDLIQNLRLTNEQTTSSEKKYRNIFENVQDVFYQTNLDGTIMEVSPSIQSYTGYSREQLIGTSAADLYYDPKEREAGVKLLLEHKALVDYEFRLKAKTGEAVDVALNARIILNEDGSISHIDGLFRNITERKKAEAKLKEAQSIAHLGYWEIDMVNNIHVWSEELYVMFGTTPDETKPSIDALLSLIHHDDVAIAQDEINETFRVLRNANSHFRFMRKDGSLGYAYIEWQFTFDKNHQPIRLNGIVQDITERKKAEIERNKMALDIMQRNKTFEEFSFIVSHNLRAPVSSILGISDLLNTNPTAEVRLELEKFLFLSVEKLDQIIRVLNDILQVRNQLTESKETVHLSILVNEIKEGMLQIIPHEEVKITTDFSDMDTLYSIKSSIKSILYNLLSNSIKFRQPGTQTLISITTKQQGDTITLSVKDNGRGIDLHRFGTRIFNLYERFHPDIEGKGIGLFMVKTQVEMLGGTVQIKSEVGVGTEVVIELPVG